ncbi:lipopolysaccharide biosynthesis protein [Hahella sp. KA22]|uniref:lipopolysaccharide biosynthesis protein n=1 Tax=Hahella sp. KA22 TaxID=1628392 RepID=UPI000FDEE59F|nr:lipopolysaccharide biosynthesis protein [Hahella sp. KA22]AZZ92825.1 lipopolysaccharide biosynthesis protein [Hahella sp. KA22]QAY56199.1 lipopolysaccharide biosynthesis protein [Hahella sp. KA22]
MSSLFRQAVYYGLGLVLMKGVSFVMLPVITHYLSPHEYGRLDVLLTLMNLLGLVIGLGVVDAMYRFAGMASSEQQRRKVIGSAYFLSCLAGVVVFAALRPATSWLNQWLPASYSDQELSLCLAALALSGFISVPLAWMRMQDRAEWFFCFSVGKACLHAALVYVLLRRGMRLEAVLWGALASNAALALAALAVQSRHIAPSAAATLARPLLKYGLPLVGGGLCIFLTQGAERWLLAGLGGAEDLAVYGVAAQFALVVALAIEPYTLWWFPRRFTVLGRADGVALNAHYAAAGAMMALSVAIGAGCVGPWALRWLLPPEYDMAAQLLPWLALAMGLKQCSHLMNVGCYVETNTRLPTALNVLVAVVAVPAYALAAAHSGVFGVVYAAVLIYALRFAVFVCASQRRLRLNYPWRDLSIVLSAAVFTPALIQMDQFVAAACVGGVGLARAGATLLRKQRLVSASIESAPCKP